MSFILDALKKSESERHRASGPVLVDVRIAPPRRGLPAWVWVLGGMLLANLVVLTWVMLRKAPPPVAAANVSAMVPVAVPATGPAPQALAAVPAPGTAAADPLHPQPTPPLAPSAAPIVPAASPINTADLPTLNELKAAGVSLPALLLNLHVYDPAPAQRYVLLNGLRLAEGEFTPDGIKVESVTERGVVLEARGRRFLLPAGN